MDFKLVVERIVIVSDEKKATNIKVLNMDGLTSLADYFVLMDANNKKHSQAIADAIVEELKLHQIELKRENGYREGQWVLQDFGDIIVHIFTPEERMHYDLDAVWGDAKIEAEGAS